MIPLWFFVAAMYCLITFYLNAVKSGLGGLAIIHIVAMVFVCVAFFWRVY